MQFFHIPEEQKNTSTLISNLDPERERRDSAKSTMHAWRPEKMDMLGYGQILAA